MTALPASQVEAWPTDDNAWPVQPKPKRVRRPSKARPETSKPALNEPESGTFVPVRERCQGCDIELHLPPNGEYPDHFDALMVMYGERNRETVTPVRVEMGLPYHFENGVPCCCGAECHRYHSRGEKRKSFDADYAEEGHKMVSLWKRPPAKESV